MRKEKFEIIRDEEEMVIGYKFGKYYLMKHYYWSNMYNWIINKTGQGYHSIIEWDKAKKNGEVELALSCKQGKERLIELANGIGPEFGEKLVA